MGVQSLTDNVDITHMARRTKSKRHGKSTDMDTPFTSGIGRMKGRSKGRKRMRAKARR